MGPSRTGPIKKVGVLKQSLTLVVRLRFTPLSGVFVVYIGPVVAYIVYSILYIAAQLIDLYMYVAHIRTNSSCRDTL